MKSKPMRVELDTLVASLRRQEPHMSRAELLRLAVEMLKLEELRLQTAALKDAGSLASKVLEVLLKQYSRIALATHEGSVRDGG